MENMQVCILFNVYVYSRWKSGCKRKLTFQYYTFALLAATKEIVRPKFRLVVVYFGPDKPIISNVNVDLNRVQ